MTLIVAWTSVTKFRRLLNLDTFIFLDKKIKINDDPFPIITIAVTIEG